jgi:hypothetical protein
MPLVPMKVHRTKVYQLFCALTLQERKDFVRFLRRRSRAKRGKIKLAFRFLCLHVAAIDQGIASNEDWWQHAFPNAQYDARALRKHQNALIHELEEFLADRKLHKEIDAYAATVRAIEQQLLLLSALLERSADHLFQHYAKKVEALIDALPGDHDKAALQLRLALLKIDYLQKVQPFKPRPEFAASQNALDRYYVQYSLKLEIATRNQQKVNLKQQDLGRLQAVLDLVSTLPRQDALTGLCLQILALSEATTYTELDSLQDTLIHAKAELAPESWKDLLYVALNFSIRRINEGQEIFQLTALNIYRVLLESGILHRDTSAFKYNFLNILRLEFNRGEHSSLSKYITEQKAILEQDEEYKNAGQFYQCEEAYSKGETQKACDCFWKVWMLEGGKKVRFAAGIFILKSYYDLGEGDALKQFANDFKKAVMGDKTTNDVKKAAYIEFLKAVQTLSKLKFNGLSRSRKTRLQQLEEAVLASPLMNSRGWVLRKIEALRKL